MYWNITCKNSKWQAIPNRRIVCTRAKWWKEMDKKVKIGEKVVSKGFKQFLKNILNSSGNTQDIFNLTHSSIILALFTPGWMTVSGQRRSKGRKTSFLFLVCDVCAFRGSASELFSEEICSGMEKWINLISSFPVICLFSQTPIFSGHRFLLKMARYHFVSMVCRNQLTKRFRLYFVLYLSIFMWFCVRNLKYTYNILLFW